jgi:hypothetical protein
VTTEAISFDLRLGSEIGPKSHPLPGILIACPVDGLGSISNALALSSSRGMGILGVDLSLFGCGPIVKEQRLEMDPEDIDSLKR